MLSHSVPGRFFLDICGSLCLYRISVNCAPIGHCFKVEMNSSWYLATSGNATTNQSLVAMRHSFKNASMHTRLQVYLHIFLAVTSLP